MSRVAIVQETRTVHGHRRAYLKAGHGPPMLLIHGIGDSSRTWQSVLPLLARSHTVIAPDLLGHGASAKPRADYSLGGFANGMRDLLALLGVERVTVVGHSMGGGVALQFAYQFPQMCERLVLVASGGLGAEVNPLLRMAAVPGAGFAIGASLRGPVRLPLLAAAQVAGRMGLIDPYDADGLGQVWGALRDRSTRSAFLRTLRSVVDVRGQSVSSRDRLHLTADIPMLLVWGSRDLMLPVAHARAVAEALPSCRLEVVPGAGHQPHRSDPRGFVAVVEQFVQQTGPAVYDAARWRGLLGPRMPDTSSISAADG